MSDHERVPYLQLSQAQLLFLVYRASGMEPEQIYPLLPNSISGKLGVQPGTVHDWRRDKPLFKEIEDRMLADPKWFHLEVINPLTLAQHDASLVRRLLGINAKGGRVTPKSMGPKERELVSDEMQLRNHAADPTARLRAHLTKIELVMPAAPAGWERKALPGDDDNVIETEYRVEERHGRPD